MIRLAINRSCGLGRLRMSTNSSPCIPEFTKNHFKTEKGNFHSLEEHHLNYFRHILGESRLVMDLSDLEFYNVDWMGHLRGNSSLALKPKTTEQVSQILSYCNQNKLAVTPQGGNTSLVGASVPVLNEIILSMSSMNNVISINEASGVLICEAGCILENLDNQLEQHKLMMPLDLGAKGSCQIGGNVATNAGGLRLFRYGNLHSNVLGLEVVKANGEVLDLMSSLKKDNTGYHLKNLFIGSEGTLGVITKVAIQCPLKPVSVNLILLGLQSFDKVLKTFAQTKANLGEILSSVEVIDGASFDFLEEKLGLGPPIDKYPFYLMIETSGSNKAHDEDKMNSFLDYSLVKHLALNGIVATSSQQIKQLWSLRERLPDTFKKDLYVFCYDFTFPLDRFYTIVEDTRNFLGNEAKCVFAFGHLADGNLHLQIAIERYTPEFHALLEERLIKRVVELNGSISAEHGIGFLKKKYLQLIKSDCNLRLMQDLKEILDPNGILNPYKII